MGFCTATQGLRRRFVRVATTVVLCVLSTTTAVVDYVENILILSFLNDTTAVATKSAAGIAGFTATKFMLTSASAVALVASLLGIVPAFRTRWRT
jgi:hypothetical protein